MEPKELNVQNREEIEVRKDYLKEAIEEKEAANHAINLAYDRLEFLKKKEELICLIVSKWDYTIGEATDIVNRFDEKFIRCLADLFNNHAYLEREVTINNAVKYQIKEMQGDRDGEVRYPCNCECCNERADY